MRRRETVARLEMMELKSKSEIENNCSTARKQDTLFLCEASKTLFAKWRWNGGVEQKAKPLRECWTFFYLHFPAPVMEAMSRICPCKTEKNPQIFGWCLQFKQSCLRATLSYFRLRKQGRKINAMRRVVFENVLKRAQRYLTQKCEEVSLQIEFTESAKNHNLCETGTKRELEKQVNAATG